MALPAEVLEMLEYPPVEDVIVPILRDRLHGILVHALIEDAAEMPFVLVRGGVWGNWGGDPRGIVLRAPFYVHTYTSGLDGDQEGAQLQEAIRIALREAVRDQQLVPGAGRLIGTRVQTAPRRVPDWATSQGPVQFADLPTQAWRYEGLHMAVVRPDI